MRVINRDGESVVIDFHAIKARLSELCTTPEEKELDLDMIVVKTISGIEDNITTSRLDELSAMICASMQSHHYAYDTLAGKIMLSNLHKNVRRIIGADTRGTFSRKLLYIAAEQPNILNESLVEFIRQHADQLDEVVDYSKDVMTYFSFRTLEKAYLLRVGDTVIESPQDMFMRVSLAIWMPRDGNGDADVAIENATLVYRQLAAGLYTHATPTLFNAGTRHEQMSSCYLLGTEDSLAGIYKTLSDCATISKWAGGIGLHVTNVRSKGSVIHSTNGRSDGIVPMLKVFNETARYCNQSGRRKGSIAVYLEPWHADVLEFIELRRQTGAETLRARDLFLALWVPDEFMRRVVADEDWYIMSPDECPGLRDTWGAEFDALYQRYVAEGRFTRKIKARSLWMGVLQSQVETGTPYIMFKDTINRRCNQNNIGTIRSSNLCVAPETQILTRKGYVTIGDLCDTDVDVWNGEQFSRVTVRKTGVDHPLVTVRFSNGESLDCTPYHKFFIEGAEHLVEAKDLSGGMQVSRFSMPVLDDVYFGDSADIHPDIVPVDRKLHIKLAWLARLADGDSVSFRLVRDQYPSMHVSSDRVFLLSLKRMLNTMGVDPVVSDGELMVSAWDLSKLVGMGFRHDALGKFLAPHVDDGRPIKIVSVSDKGRRDDTYCFTEPLANAGVFNGIRAGNCAEITEYSDENFYAVCNLASIAVNRFYDVATGQYDHAGLHTVSQQITRNLNRVIDINFYPVPETRKSNMMMRPIGIGVQGFGDLYNMMNVTYGSPDAVRIDAEVLETIYHGSMTASVKLAKKDGPYPGIRGSMFERGEFQFDTYEGVVLSGRWDWESLRADLRAFGCRNSLLTALMPTASTSQVLGNSECFEPIQANIFKRTTLAGEFLVVNKHLMKTLMDSGKWNEDVRRQLLQSDGSVAGMDGLDGHLRDVFKTIWEVPQRAVIDHAAARAPFVDQSQSMNLYFATPNYQKLNSALVYAWNKGLKTGCYYMRSRPAAEATKVTSTQAPSGPVCRRDDAGCITCSS